MLEYFIVYDVATGAICYRAAVQLGGVALQDPGEGRAVLILPANAFPADHVDLDVLKAALVARIDEAAEALRLRFITGGVGQALTYQYKAAEARAWAADPDATVPFLSTEAIARGMELADLVAEVAAQVEAWTTIGSRIEAMRLSAKATIAAAETPEPALVAGTIDWAALAS